jgi:Ca2+-binding EF-hand superfamily protein
VKRQLNPFRAFDAFDKEERGIVSLSDLQRILASMQLAFSARDYYEVARLADPKNIG